jgi:hypothetical protein
MPSDGRRRGTPTGRSSPSVQREKNNLPDTHTQRSFTECVWVRLWGLVVVRPESDCGDVTNVLVSKIMRAASSPPLFLLLD